MTEPLSIVCAYTGPPDTCAECGGYDPTGTGFCSHDCRADFHTRGDRHEAERLARRAADDAFGVEADKLRAQGHTDQEIDELLKDMA